MLSDNPEQCFELLHCLAVRSRVDGGAGVDLWAAGEALGFSPDMTQALSRHLLDHRMLQPTSLAGTVVVSPVGLASIALAKADPDRPSVHFPALSGFFGLGDEIDVGLSKHAVSVLLDQLSDCRGVLGAESGTPTPLEHRLSELEQLVVDSRVETSSLRRGLQRLRASLPD
ncbi:MAG: hypothetical protein AAGA11_13670 [Pseudomonadota bacterium]